MIEEHTSSDRTHTNTILLLQRAETLDTRYTKKWHFKAIVVYVVVALVHWSILFGDSD